MRLELKKRLEEEWGQLPFNYKPDAGSRHQTHNKASHSRRMISFRDNLINKINMM